MGEDRITIKSAEDLSTWQLIDELKDRGYNVSDPEKAEFAEDRPEGKPIELVVPSDVAKDNLQRFIGRLEDEFGYAVHKEHEGTSVIVYTVAPAYDEKEWDK